MSAIAVWRPPLIEHVTPELKAWDFSDLQSGQDQPDDPTDFLELLMAGIGPKDEPGFEWFDFEVCTPKRLSRNLQENPTMYEFGRFRIIVNEWNLEVILSAVHDLCRSAPLGDWSTVTRYLATFGMWEYEPFR